MLTVQYKELPWAIRKFYAESAIIKITTPCEDGSKFTVKHKEKSYNSKVHEWNWSTLWSKWELKDE